MRARGSVAVTVLGDLLLKPDAETFTVELTQPSGALLDTASALPCLRPP